MPDYATDHIIMYTVTSMLARITERYILQRKMEIAMFPDTFKSFFRNLTHQPSNCILNTIIKILMGFI